jgi:hypothetical protein
MIEEEGGGGNLIRHVEIERILNGPRDGQVDGIQFSFVHSELPSSEDWVCVNPYFPELVFPWNFSGTDIEFETEWVPGCDTRQTRVRGGDCIKVWRVERQRREGIFPVHNPHDAFIYFADLLLVRDGETFAFIEEQLAFVARDALGAFSPMHGPFDRNDNYEYEDAFRITFEKVRQRINRLGGRSLIVPQSPTGYFGWVNDTGEIRPLTVSEAKDVTAGIMPPHLSKFAKESRGGMPGTEWEETAILVSNEFDQALWTGFSRRSILDLAAAAGYALAQAEMELGIKPLALEGLKAKASRKPAHDARRKAGDPVRAAAKEYILKNPKTSQGACARHVSQKLARDERAVNRTIADMFEERTTDKGVKEKRPKPEFLTKTKAPG